MPARVPQSCKAGRLPIQHDTSLLQAFDRFFSVVTADTPDLVREAHRLRHQVYCVENDFEPRDRNPNGLEIDAYDARSAHSLLYFAPSRRFIGTVRLVLPDARHPYRSFPFQSICGARLRAVRDAAEVSRFCISRELRRPPMTTGMRIAALSGAGGAPATVDAVDEGRRILPYAAMGLVRGLVETSMANGVKHWLVLAAPTLLRFLAGFGIHLDPVAPMVDFHGPRVPCCSNLQQLLELARQERPEIWRILTDDGRLEVRGGSFASPIKSRHRPGRAEPRRGGRWWPRERPPSVRPHSHYT